MEKKITKNYVASAQKFIIGNKKRNTFIIGSNAANSSKSKNMTIKKSRGCSGCSRKRKIQRG